MNIRSCITAFTAAGLVAGACVDLKAQDIVLQVNRTTGDLTITGADAMVVDLAGYDITSQRETLETPGNFTGLAATQGGTGVDWTIVGTPSTTLLQDRVSTPDPLIATSINNTLSFGIGSGIYSSLQERLDAGLGVDVEQNDLGILYFDATANEIRTGQVQFVGENLINNIGVTVNLATGEAILENESPFNDLVVTGYVIEAATDDSLNVDETAFNGVGGSFTSPVEFDGENIGQVDSTGAGVELDSGDAISLGTVGGLLNDLSFSFILAGEGESSRTGFVKYVVPGDFNNDGTVDVADYTVWRDNLGAADESLISENGSGNSLVDVADYELWRDNFGLVAPTPPPAEPPAAAAAPEPTSAVLMALLGVAVATRRVAG